MIMSSVSECVSLVNTLQHEELHGTYSVMPGELCSGRSVYKHGPTNQYIWYDQRNGFWTVSDNLCKNPGSLLGYGNTPTPDLVDVWFESYNGWTSSPVTVEKKFPCEQPVASR